MTDPRSLLYTQLSPEEAQALAAETLKSCEDGELFMQFVASEAFGFDDGRSRPPTIRATRASACAASRAR